MNYIGEKPVVIYHGACPDGFCAAWVLHKRFPNARFVPGYYGDPIPSGLAEMDVILVDFSYPRPVLATMAALVRTLTVLDHHKTAQADLVGFEEEACRLGCETARVTFDMTRSGAGLAWDACFPNEPRPWIVDYVEDFDLWNLKLDKTRTVNASIRILQYEFVSWDSWQRAGEENFDFIIRTGGSVLAKIQQYCREMEVNFYVASVAGKPVPCVNAPQVDISTLLEYLMQKTRAPMVVGWRLDGRGRYQYSLRSTPDGPDVSEIAKRYGGGGHAHLAAFSSHEFLASSV